MYTRFSFPALMIFVLTDLPPDFGYDLWFCLRELRLMQSLAANQKAIIHHTEITQKHRVNSNLLYKPLSFSTWNHAKWYTSLCNCYHLQKYQRHRWRININFSTHRLSAWLINIPMSRENVTVLYRFLSVLMATFKTQMKK